MSQGRLPFAPAFDHLVYVRVVEACQLRCLHCFIPGNPKRLDLVEIARIPAHVRSFAKPGSRILLQWHGGEPTLAGADWLEQAIRSVEEGGPEFAWLHGIQTNLVAYGPDWAELYRRRFGGEVGVSWDPPGIRVASSGPLASAERFEEIFWANLDRLLADGLAPYLVVTGTAPFFDAFPNPADFFDMLVRRGIRRAHIERLTRTGYARDNWARLGVDNASWSRRMSRFARAYVRWTSLRPAGRDLFLSPFDGILDSAADLAAGRGRGYGCWSGSCDTTFHTVDADGYRRGCTALTSEDTNPRAKDRLSLDFGDISGERAKRTLISCTGCRFRPICSSGCLAVSMDDGSGECSGGYGLFDAAASLATSWESTR
jgi:radical SAM protein with 4Fe4S-binding SPASM domain